MKYSKPEILAPAGDLNALKSAVFNGADAVYLGLEDFNARKKATNFCSDNLKEIVDFCHFYGVKVFVTLNTNVRQSELSDVEKTVGAIDFARADAVIATDLAVVSTIKSIAPQIPVHFSTQAGVCNLEAARFAEKIGCDRVVLSRETCIDDIKAIKRNTNLEIEYFVQGALCVAFSGKCLLSSMINGGSGNRGRCLQPCRLKYQCEGKEACYLSTKDLCMLPKLKQLFEAGVDSFKIEGRLRSPEYVAAATKVYREAVDGNFKYSADSINRLKIAFNRGDYSTGYLDGNGDIISSGVQSNVGLTVGKVISATAKTATVRTSFPLTGGEGCKIVFADSELYGGTVRIINKHGNDYVIEAVGAKSGANFNITKTVEKSAFSAPQKKVSMILALTDDSKLKLVAQCEGESVFDVTEQTVERAVSSPMPTEQIYSSLSKTGDSGFVVTDVDSTKAEGLFIPKSMLNGLRRNVLEKLKQKISDGFKGTYGVVNNCNYPKTIPNNAEIQNNLIAVCVDGAIKLSKTVMSQDIVIYSPSVFSVAAANVFLESARKLGDAKVFLRLPPQADGQDVKLLDGILTECRFDGVMAENYFAITLAEKHGLEVFSGGLLNVYNSRAATVLPQGYLMPSIELNANEILKTFGSGVFVYAYGKMPLMNFKHCPVKAVYGGDCSKCKYKGPISYTDRKGYSFEVVRRKVANCQFDLLNAVKCDVGNKLKSLPFNLYLDVTSESADNVDTIVEAFASKKPCGTDNVTYGHLFRGAL